MAFSNFGIKFHPHGSTSSKNSIILQSIYSKFSRDTTQVGTTPISTKIEEAPLNLQPGIRLQNVYKKYGKNTVVDGVSIDIYKDQITALLGYNGAGKTTTMLIITGK